MFKIGDKVVTLCGKHSGWVTGFMPTSKEDVVYYAVSPQVSRTGKRLYFLESNLQYAHLPIRKPARV